MIYTSDKAMDMRGKRFAKPRAVLAFERDATVYCKSMAEAMLRYEIPSTSMLERLIERGGVHKDGYTTFDWASDEEYRRSMFDEYRKIASDAITRSNHRTTSNGDGT